MKKDRWKQIVRQNLSPTLVLGWLAVAAVVFGLGLWAWQGL